MPKTDQEQLLGMPIKANQANQGSNQPADLTPYTGPVTRNEISSHEATPNRVGKWIDKVPEDITPIPSAFPTPETTCLSSAAPAKKTSQSYHETINAPDSNLTHRRKGIGSASTQQLATMEPPGMPVDNSDDDSDASVESDYYYDDHGKSHTYYRTKRLFGRPIELLTIPQPMHSIIEVEGGDNSSTAPQRTATEVAIVSVNTLKTIPAPRSPSCKPKRSNSQKSKSSHPVNNGSIYLAPPMSAKNHPSRQNSVVDKSSVVSVPHEDLAHLPDNLRGLGRNIHKLSTEELLHISAMVSRKANREVYSVLQYSGEAWYLPEVRRVRPGEKRWELKYIWGSGLVITVAGMRLRIRVLSYMMRMTIMALTWFIVWSSTIPKSWSYRSGYFLDPFVTIMISAIVGGLVCRLLQIPPLLGVLWMGIMWNNIPHVGWFTAGILPQVRTITSRSGLAVILLRCGYSINVSAVAPLFKNCFLAAAALIVETIAHALMAQYYLEYDDWKWSFCQGLLAALPSAAVLVPGVLLLQADGYSRSTGPLPLMLATLGIETPFGIWAVNFLYGLISSDKDIGFEAGMGPVQIVGGAIVGLVGAAMVHLFVLLVRNEAERLPGTGQYTEAHLQYLKWMAVFIALVIGHAVLFLGYQIEMAGGGVVAVTTVGFAISHSWGKLGDEWLDLKKNLAMGLASVWDIAAMPYLFSIAGSKVVLAKVFNRDMFPKALLVFVVASFSRVIYTIFVPSIGLGFTWGEKLFHGLAVGFPKATVQIAMASNPVDYITKKIAALPANTTISEELQHELDMANMFQATIVLFVLIAVPISSIWITRGGPMILKRE